ncbi:alpha/beta fold hydrolase [Noviherbaspirillum aerium]|uniref:alpha/beta hydrolase n=1 Tax=Noviherbaspirillum aerium TaxID=2588497 RepID=UPI00124C35A6|nr:alpha/beta hydrolase [Noviherbaspirillum aerium]
MNLVYIHGNHQSGNSFNFIRSQLWQYESTVLEYESQNGFFRNHQAMLDGIGHLDNLFFVAHSLGGIHALHLANELAEKVVGGVTLSTPYGGSKAAEVVQFFLPFSKVVKDIQPLSQPILQGHEFTLSLPWVNVLTTEGHSPFMAAANDGVVTHESMRHREDISVVEVASNHYEVLLNYEVIEIIRNTIAQVGWTKRLRDTYSVQNGICRGA